MANVLTHALFLSMLGSMGMKRIVVQVVNQFGYRRVLVALWGAGGASSLN
jgi:hypothetical protein